MDSLTCRLRGRLRGLAGSGGFTLMETLVTAGITGMLAAVAFPNLSTALNAHRLMGGVRITAGQLRVTRSAAISRNRISRLVVGDSGTLTTQIWNPTTSAWVAVGSPSLLDGGISVSSVSPANGVTFCANGGLRDPGAAAGTCTAAASPVTITVANARGGTRQITVSLLGSTDIS